MTKAKAKKATPVTDVLINMVVDASGSMGYLAGPTREGVNAFLEEQKALPGKTLLSLTLFDTNFDVRFVAMDLNEVPLLGSADNPYTPNGGTALYDAVGATIRGTEAWLAAHPDFTGRVVTVVNTDGEENRSRTTTLDQVNALITAKSAQGWEFIFLGAGAAAWTEGAKFVSIPQSNQYNYVASSFNTTSNYAGVSSSLRSARISGTTLAENLTPVVNDLDSP